MPYSAKQLVSLACQIGKVQSGMAPQVGMFLNMLLETYAQTLDLDSIRRTEQFPISSVPTGLGANSAGYALPADYKRAEQVFYNVQGTIFDLDQIPLTTYNTLFQGTGIANYPESYATDISQQASELYGASLIYFYFPAAIPLVVNLLYRPQVGAIANPETSNAVPFFENQLILLKDLSSQAMMLGDDSRKESFDAEVEKRMRKYLIMDDDKEGYAQTVKLDKQLFRPVTNLPPTKQTAIF